MNTDFERSKTSYKDERLTPSRIINALGEFDLDPCSPVVRPFPTAKNHFTIEDDGLTKQWFGRVWCNPPYSDIENWFKKMVYHGNVMALAFARTDTNWFFRYVWNKADSIFFIKQRIVFLDVQGQKLQSNAGAPSVLIAYGKNNTEVLDNCSLEGHHQLINQRTIIVVGVSPTWFSIVSIAVKSFGDNDLKPLYDEVERIAPDKVMQNQHWKAKVRQQLYEYRNKKLSK